MFIQRKERKALWVTGVPFNRTLTIYEEFRIDIQKYNIYCRCTRLNSDILVTDFATSKIRCSVVTECSNYWNVVTIGTMNHGKKQEKHFGNLYN